MTEATQTIPHFRLVTDLNVGALLAARDRLGETSHSLSISINDLLIKATAAALMDVPQLNVQWADGVLHQYHHADIAVVTAVPDGVSTPILRAADCIPIQTIALEVRELIARAKRRALTVDEVVGGSFTISNLGMHGVDEFDAIINAPQCAVLAVGRVKPKVVASDSGEVSVAQVLRATLSVDHRAADGVTAARFLNALRHRVERPDWIDSA